MTKPILALLFVSLFSLFCAKKEEPAVEPVPTEVVFETPAPSITVVPEPVVTPEVGRAECAEGTREVAVITIGKEPRQECRECRGGKWHKCKS